MSTSKIIAVIGATGNQGSSVVKTFLDLPGWHVRGLTRQPTSTKAQVIGALGAEMVQADLEDVASLVKAFQGAHAIFVNTDFWLTYLTAMAAGNDRATSSTLGYNAEVQHAKNAAIAASRSQTLEKFIYSTLGPMKAVSGGKYSHCYHWDTKAEAANYIEKELPQLNKKTSLIYMGAYSTNPFLIPQRNAETGKYAIAMPAPIDTVFPIIDAEKSTGPFVRALVEDEPAGTKLLAYDSNLNAGEVLDAWREVTGKEAEFVQLSMEGMHELTGLPYEVLEGPAFIAEYGYVAGVEGIIFPEQLKSKVETATYKEFLASQDDEFLLNFQPPKI
ncbi:hypothetical protein FZEAL_9266 [Fusarium zealandicum]|uniref:NmrA-like domain-containing protein n=1 Tax=Fusarium zealandicum TaxID=1053134 RepID=A0A8H4UCN3_9HYPO|nr:hypothetical protein FZEAL_9266 [Fusarium zealandicum]